MKLRLHALVLWGISSAALAGCGGSSSHADPSDGAIADGGVDGSTPGGDDDSDASTPTEPEPITLTGIVVDNQGLALPGVTVFVLGGAPVVTDVAGAFSVPGIVPPYDALLVSAAAKGGTLYVGLTEPDPWLVSQFDVPRDHEATVEGTLVAGDSDFASPNAADTYTRTDVALDRGGQTRISNPMDAADGFGLVPQWGGASTTSGTFHALQYTRAGDLVTAFHGYASKSLTVSDGDTVDLGMPVMDSVAAAHLSGTTSTEGASFEVAQIASAVSFLDGGAMELNGQTAALDTFDHLLPGALGAKGRVTVTALSSDVVGAAGIILTRAGLALPTTDLEIIVPDLPLPLPLSPAAGAGGVGEGSELVFEDVPNAVHLVTFGSASFSGMTTLWVVTTEDHVRLPDLAPYGVELDPEADYQWWVRSYVGYASVDDLAVPELFAEIQRGLRDSVAAVGPRRAATTP
jgi:hypothetical protein